MPRHRVSSMTLVGLLVLPSVGTAWGVGPDAQRIVVRRCVAALPPGIAPYFESRVADLEERVVEPDGAWRRDRKMRVRASWDHLWIDIKAQNGSVSARLAAAEAFPRREVKAKKLFKTSGFARQGGRLPWAVEDLHIELVRAFEQGDGDEIVKAAGHLIHFAWAASQPFNVTVNHTGRDTGNLYLGEPAMGEPYFPHQSVHHRVMGEMVRRYRNRYLELVQVRPIDLRPVSDPLESCFRQLVGSLARLDDLLTADREITERLGATDGESLVKREDEFYELLDARCGDIVVERLRSGAILAAGLIAGAWERAGGPAIADRGTPNFEARTVPQATPEEEPQTEPTSSEEPKTGRYVGSKQSNVFHRPDCKHAKQIRPWNLVFYESAEDAKRQGKRPCRICRPE